MRRVSALVVIGLLVASCTSDGVTATTVVDTSAATTANTSTTTPPKTEPEPMSTTQRLEELGGEPCPDSDFTCVSIEVPLDHFAATSETTEVFFAILPASGERRGVFVTATGGPGSTGIAYADWYTSALDESITENFDIVFFDQRGVGMSGGLTCPAAAVAYYRKDPLTGLGFDEAGLTAAAETFTTDCLTEAGDSPLWPYLATAQVVEDIEVFRTTMGYDSIVIYGESYGTQVAQTYAAAHGGQTERMIIDGVVDLTLTGLEFFVDQANAFTDTLQATFDGCGEDPACDGDFEARSPEEEYDRLVGQLTEGAMTTEFPLPDGSTAERALGLGDLEVATAGQMYGEVDRAILLRALAASATRDDLVPLLSLFYVTIGMDPVSETAVDDPTWSDAIYYGVDCLDYDYPGETPEAKAEGFFSNATGFETQRLGSAVVAELPCAFWPYRPNDPERPEPLVADGIATLVLGATADPATPYQQGIDVFGRLAEGYSISQTGGPHVIFGRGNDCPDVAVTAFIVDGEVPTVSECEGYVVDYYPPLFPLSLSEFSDAFTFLAAIEDEVTYLPEYWYWDGYEETAAGCRHGGTLTMGPTDVGYSFEFDSCAFAADGPLTGRAEYDAENDVFTIDQIAVGSDECLFSYERSGENYDVADQCEALFADG